MRWWVGLLLCLGAVPSAWAAEPAPDSRAFVRVTTSTTTPFVNQPFRVGIRFGVDRAYFDQHAVQLFRKELDLPVAIQAPWIDEISGTRFLATNAAQAPRGERLALNGRVGEAQVIGVREQSGAAFEVHAIERTVLPGEPGPIVLAAPTLRFAYASRFEEDFVGGRIPLDRKEATLRGDPLTITVQPLPTVGRPAAFVDAVGQFEVWAETDRAEIVVGEAFHLRLRISGDGNLATLAPPGLRDLAGFHVYGVRDEIVEERRVLTYELAAVRADVRAIPPIAFAYFDPGPPAGYVVVKTQPQPVRVRAAADPVRTPPAASPTRPSSASTSLPWMWIVVALLGLGVLAWILRARALASEVTIEHRRWDPARGASAEVALAEAPRRSTHEQSDALAEFLGAHLDVSPAAVISHDLVARLLTRGVPDALAHRVADAMEALVASRYGGPAVSWDPALTKELAASLRANS